MSLDLSALGSIQLTLDDVLERLASVTADLHDDDPISSELHEVERQLSTAARRLEKAARSARR